MSEFYYGGQAVIEGVMMRGRNRVAVAVRKPNGEIALHEAPLPSRIYNSRIARTPFVRGLLLLWDALGLGTKALMWSADVAIGEEEGGSAGFSGPVAWGTVILSLAFGVGLFFLLPTAISQQKDTPPPRVALLGQGRRLAPGLALLLITLVLALLPIRPAGSAPVTGELHVLLNHGGALLAQTGNLPPEIAAKLPPNVDPAMILGGERFPVDLLIRIDGETLAQRSYRPSGLRREGASQATEKWPIAAGSHQVQIDLRDDGAVWRTVFDATLDFGVGESVNLYYEGERDAFLRRE